MRDGVGLVAVLGHGQAARLVGRGLRALRTRGGDAAGVVGLQEGRVRREAGVAWLDDAPALEALAGSVAVGATLRLGDDALGRDRAVGLVDPPAVPAVGRWGDEAVAVVLSGALVDAVEGIAVETPSEVLLQLVLRSSQRTWVNRVVDALWGLRGGFAGVVATAERLVALRDAAGLRPLVLGRDADTWMVASDARAVEACGAAVVRAVEPGELVIVEGGGVLSVRPLPRRPVALCALEALALGAPNDPFGGQATDAVRRAIGAELAVYAPAETEQVAAADAVSAPAALGWAEVTGARFEALFSDGEAPSTRCVGRSVALIASDVDGAERAARLTRAGARDVHLRWLGLESRFGCPYGVSVDKTQTGVALPLDRLRSTLGVGLCDGCMSGVWPVMPEVKQEQLALFRKG